MRQTPHSNLQPFCQTYSVECLRALKKNKFILHSLQNEGRECSHKQQQNTDINKVSVQVEVCG